MGNIQCTKYPVNETTENTDCIICWEKVESIDEVDCIQCNIHLNAYCEELYRNGKGYCKCHNCQSIGTLVSSPLRHYMK